MRADASETELSVAVARHFEAMPVDEEAILGRFFEHLDGVDGGEPYGDDVDGVAKVHEQVAAKVSLSEENGSWILASVVKYDATSDAYAVQDEDDSKIIELPASRVRRLGLPEDGLDELAKGERVVAIFPETTSFYRAVVSKAPKRGPGGAPSEIVLKFEDDEDDAGRTPHRRVSLRYVLRERQRAAPRRSPPPPAAYAAADPYRPVAAAAALGARAAPPPGQAWYDRGAGGAPGGDPAARGGGAATYSDMIAHALRKCPDEQGDFKAICAIVEEDFFDQLNWKLESDLRKTPVWKSSVRKILFSNSRFRHASATDKNLFTFS